MTISAQKELILPPVIDLLESKDFKYSDGFEHTFTKKTKFGGVKLSLFFSEMGESSNSLYSLSHKVVEDIILEIGVPYNSWVKQKKGKKLLYTLYDGLTEYGFTRRSVEIGTAEALEIEYVETEADVLRWKNALLNYINYAGEQFIAKFSYLPNVLRELDSIEQSENLSYLKIMLGRFDHLFRVLIISKLCNDTNFKYKFHCIKDEIMLEENSDWHPYFKALESTLNSLNPIYNLEET